MPIENEQVKDYQHPKPVIYLDRNAFSLVTKYAKTQDPKLEKFATLVDHLGKRNSLPFSDIHLFELMNTGRKSDLSPVEKENFINIDLKIMKLISKDEIIYFDNKGTCRVTNSCPESKYKEIMLLEGFEEIYYDLLDLMPKAMIKKLRKITGLGPRELNNKTSSEADKAIENSMERLLELSTIENIENDEEYKNLMLEQAQKSLMLMDKVEKWLFDLVTHLMQSLSNEQKEIALKALEDFKIKFQEAKELNLKNIDDLNSGEILKSMKSPDAIKKMSQEFILETLEQINQDTGVKIDGDLITFVQRNLFGYHSKTLTDRNSQSSDHHDFMHARFIKHSFYYITAYEKEAKIFQKKYGHLNPNCKILSANQFVEHMKENYNIKFINELKEEQSQNL